MYGKMAGVVTLPVVLRRRHCGAMKQSIHPNRAFIPTVLARGWTSLWNFGTNAPSAASAPQPHDCPWQVVQVLNR